MFFFEGVEGRPNPLSDVPEAWEGVLRTPGSESVQQQPPSPVWPPHPSAHPAEGHSLPPMSWSWLTPGSKDPQTLLALGSPRTSGTYLVSIQESIHQPGARVLWWKEGARVSLAGLL